MYKIPKALGGALSSPYGDAKPGACISKRGGESVYAIIADSGKQYKVEEGKYLYTEKQKDKVEGDEIIFDKVIMLKKDDGQVLIGKPYLENVTVKGKVVEHKKARKVRSIKFRPRKNSKTTKNHRQWYTTILIEKIEVK